MIKHNITESDLSGQMPLRDPVKPSFLQGMKYKLETIARNRRKNQERLSKASGNNSNNDSNTSDNPGKFVAGAMAATALGLGAHHLYKKFKKKKKTNLNWGDQL